MVAFTGPLRTTLNVSLISKSESFTISTGIVCTVSPGLKISTPSSGPKSAPLVAVPLLVA